MIGSMSAIPCAWATGEDEVIQYTRGLEFIDLLCLFGMISSEHSLLTASLTFSFQRSKAAQKIIHKMRSEPAVGP